MYLFELNGYSKDGRLAKYEKELITLIKANDDDGIISLSYRIFADCANYLISSFNLKIPELHLNLLNHESYTKLSDEWDLLLGKIPRRCAFIAGDRFGSPPEIYVDFEKLFSIFNSTGQPINFLINLIACYVEELVHSADPSKSETEIHQTVCDALEGFAEVKLTEEIKKNRLEYAREVDGKKIS